MELNEAIQLINNNDVSGKNCVKWADLGCGDGLFTRALASLLPSGSIVYAVDKSRHSIGEMSGMKVEIRFVQADFERKLNLPDLDGILMANSLHFVKDKESFVEGLITYLNEEGKLIIVEYDTTISNPWVPFPVNYIALRELFLKAGFNMITKLSERKSSYGSKNMYSCLVR